MEKIDVEKKHLKINRGPLILPSLEIPQESSTKRRRSRYLESNPMENLHPKMSFKLRKTNKKKSFVIRSKTPNKSNFRGNDVKEVDKDELVLKKYRRKMFSLSSDLNSDRRSSYFNRSRDDFLQSIKKSKREEK